MFENPICYLCGHDESKVLFSHTLPGPIVQCQHCSLIYVCPIEQDISQAYDLHLNLEQRQKIEQKISETDYLASTTFVAANMPDFDLMIKDFKDRLAVLEKYGHSDGKLLDVGAHSGVLLCAARELGYEPYGVEPEMEPCVYGKQHWDLDMFCGSLIEAQFPDNYFDIVTLLAVMEHMRNPLCELKEIKRVLKPDGMLVIEVPNIDSLMFKFTRRYWRHFIKGHLIHFSPNTLTAFLAKAGFNVVEIHSFRRSTTLKRLLSVAKRKTLAKLWGISLLIKLTDIVIEKSGLSEQVITIDPGDNMTAYMVIDKKAAA